MTLKNYQNVQLAVEDPRATEYRLFGQVTGALIDAKTENVQGAPLVEAIDWNKRLWRTLAADCMDDRNTLTEDVRAKIVSLSLWVSKYSRRVTRDRAPIDPLIEINRTIMQGLIKRCAHGVPASACFSREALPFPCRAGHRNTPVNSIVYMVSERLKAGSGKACRV